MKLLPNGSFEKHFASEGEVFHGAGTWEAAPSYGFKPGCWFSLLMPEQVLARIKLLGAPFDLGAPQSDIWIWRRGGTWKRAAATQMTPFRAMQRAIGALGDRLQIPAEAGTVFCEAQEWETAFLFVFLQSIVARGKPDDVFIKFAAEEVVFQVDHDELLIVDCKDEQCCERIRAAFAACGFQLP